MLFQIKGVCFSYGSVPVLENVTFNVQSGEMLGIVGPNGSGKSTLLRCLARVLKPRVGTIFLDRKNLADLRGREVGRCLGYVPPPGTGQAFPCTVLETILQGRRPHLTWGVGERDLVVASRALDYLGLTDLGDRQLGELSSGQRQKVFIARALAQEPVVFLLDEPTATLDVRYQLEVLALMQELARSHQRLVVVVLHDLNLAARYSDHLILLHEGRIFAAGAPEAVLSPENIRTVYGVEAVVAKNRWGLQITPVAPLNGPANGDILEGKEMAGKTLAVQA
ncbi:MAG: ABC transporter ATP-binding protein [Armatimonadetes bacterium]|nr:ABC transporter ATP-binding protein [Armatimonadota bacterium]